MRYIVIGCIMLLAMTGTAFSETKEPPKKLAVDLGSGVKLDMTLIPAGEFKMGSGESAVGIVEDAVNPTSRGIPCRPEY